MALGSIGIVMGDITTIPAVAIVNAANETLLPGGGVCGAIHIAAGPDLEAECQALGGCPTGEARITRGYLLPARYVIHAVTPKYRNGASGEAEQLRNCYKAIFRIARDRKFQSLAIPALGTGACRFPIEEAAQIALEEASIAINEFQIRIAFCCFDTSNFAAFHVLVSRIAFSRLD